MVGEKFLRPLGPFFRSRRRGEVRELLTCLACADLVKIGPEGLMGTMRIPLFEALGKMHTLIDSPFNDSSAIHKIFRALVIATYNDFS